MTEYATADEEGDGAEDDKATAAVNEMYPESKDGSQDVTDDVTVTSDGGKRRNKTWRRPAVGNDDREQKSSASEPNNDGTLRVFAMLMRVNLSHLFIYYK